MAALQTTCEPSQGDHSQGRVFAFVSGPCNIVDSKALDRRREGLMRPRRSSNRLDESGSCADRTPVWASSYSMDLLQVPCRSTSDGLSALRECPSPILRPGGRGRPSYT